MPLSAPLSPRSEAMRGIVASLATCARGSPQQPQASPSPPVAGSRNIAGLVETASAAPIVVVARRRPNPNPPKTAGSATGANSSSSRAQSPMDSPKGPSKGAKRGAGAVKESAARPPAPPPPFNPRRAELALADVRLVATAQPADSKAGNDGTKGGEGHSDEDTNGGAVPSTVCAIQLRWRLAAREGPLDDGAASDAKDRPQPTAESSAAVEGSLVSEYAPSAASASCDGKEAPASRAASPRSLPPSRPASRSHSPRAVNGKGRIGDHRSSCAATVPLPLPKAMARLLAMTNTSAAGTAKAGAYWHLSVKPAALPSLPGAASSPHSHSQPHTQSPDPSELGAAAFELFLVCVHPLSWLADDGAHPQQQPGYARPTTRGAAAAASAPHGRGCRSHSGGGGGGGEKGLGLHGVRPFAPEGSHEAVTASVFRCTIVVSLELGEAEGESAAEPIQQQEEVVGAAQQRLFFQKVAHTFADTSPVVVTASFARLWAKASTHRAPPPTSSSAQCSGATPSASPSLPPLSLSHTNVSTLGLGQSYGGHGLGGTLGGASASAAGGTASASASASAMAELHSTGHLLQPPTVAAVVASLAHMPATRQFAAGHGIGADADADEATQHGGAKRSPDDEEDNKGDYHNDDGNDDSSADKMAQNAKPKRSANRLPPIEYIPNPRYRPPTAAAPQSGYARPTRSAEGRRGPSTTPASPSAAGGHALSPLKKGRAGSAVAHSFSHHPSSSAQRHPSTDGRLSVSAGGSRHQHRGASAAAAPLSRPRKEWAFERPAPNTNVWETILNTAAAPSLVAERRRKERAAAEEASNHFHSSQQQRVKKAAPLHRAEATAVTSAFRVLACRSSPIPSLSHILLQLVIVGVWEVTQHIEVIREVREARRRGHEGGEEPEEYCEHADENGEPPMIAVRRYTYAKSAHHFATCSVTVMKRVGADFSGANSVHPPPSRGGWSNSDGCSDGYASAEWGALSSAHQQNGPANAASLGDSTAGPFGPSSSSPPLSPSMRGRTGSSGGLRQKEGTPPRSNSMTLPRPTSAANNINGNVYNTHDFNSTLASTAGSILQTMRPLSAILLGPPAPHAPRPLRRTQRVTVAVNGIPTDAEEALQKAIATTMIPNEAFTSVPLPKQHQGAEEGGEGETHRTGDADTKRQINDAMASLAAQRAHLLGLTAEKATAFFLLQKLGAAWQINSGGGGGGGGANGGPHKPAYILATRPSTGPSSATATPLPAAAGSASVGETRVPPFLSRLRPLSSVSDGGGGGSGGERGQEGNYASRTGIEMLPPAAALRSGVVAAIPRSEIEGYVHNAFAATPPDCGGDPSSSPHSRGGASPSAESFIHAHPQTKGMYSFHNPPAHHAFPTVLTDGAHQQQQQQQQRFGGGSHGACGGSYHRPTPLASSAVRPRALTPPRHSSSSSVHSTNCAALPPLTSVVGAGWVGGGTSVAFVVFSVTAQRDKAGGAKRTEKEKGEPLTAYFVFVCPTTAPPSSLAVPARRSRLSFSAVFVGYVPDVRCCRRAESVGGDDASPRFALGVAGSSFVVSSEAAVEGCECGGSKEGSAPCSCGARWADVVGRAAFLPAIAFDAEGVSYCVPLASAAAHDALAAAAAAPSAGGGGGGDGAASPPPTRYGGSYGRALQQQYGFSAGDAAGGATTSSPSKQSALRPHSAAMTAAISRGVNAPDLAVWATREEVEAARRASVAGHHNALLLSAVALCAPSALAASSHHSEEAGAVADPPVSGSAAPKKRAKEDGGSFAATADATPSCTPIRRRNDADGTVVDAADPIANSSGGNGNADATAATELDRKEGGYRGDSRISSRSGRKGEGANEPLTPAAADALRRAMVQEYMLCSTHDARLAAAKEELRRHVSALVAPYTEEDYARDKEAALASGNASFHSRPSSSARGSSRQLRSAGGARQPSPRGPAVPASTTAAASSNPNPKQQKEDRAVVFTSSVRSRREIRAVLARYAAVDEQHTKLRAYQAELLAQIGAVARAVVGSVGPNPNASFTSGGDGNAAGAAVASAPPSPSSAGKGRLRSLPPRSAAEQQQQQQQSKENEAEKAAAAVTADCRTAQLQRALAAHDDDHGDDEHADEASGDAAVGGLIADWVSAEEEAAQREELASQTVLEVLRSAANSPRPYA